MTAPSSPVTGRCDAQFRTVIPTTMSRMMAFHEDPRALAKLTPFPIITQLHRDDRTSITEGELEFTLWFGPLPVRWVARHEPLPDGQIGFADRLVSGPMQAWYHRHIFREVPGGVELTDCIVMEHRPGGAWSLFTRLFFSGLPLRFLFIYRHLRTRLGVMGKG
jgi:ligand-binding SRPBCC domain-containing protein